MPVRSKYAWLTIGAILWLAVSLPILFFSNLPYGLGLTWDSAQYVESGFHFSQGNGVSLEYPNGELRRLPHFAPAYPMLLGSIGRYIDLDLRDLALVIQCFLFAMNAILFAGLIWLLTNRRAYCVLGVAVFCISPTIIRAHLFLSSEPFFLTLWIVAFCSLILYKKTESKQYLYAFTLATSICALTRYAGVIWLPVGGIYLLHEKIRNPGKNIRQILEYILISFVALLPLMFWFLNLQGNQVNIGNRFVIFSPPDHFHFQQLTEAITAFLGITKIVPEPARIPLNFLFASLVIFWLLRSSKSVFDNLCLVFAAFYIVFIYFVITLVDHAIPLDQRILLPLYVSVLTASLWKIASITMSTQRHFFIGVLVISVWVICSYIFGSFSLLQVARGPGFGFANANNKKSLVLREIQQMPKDQIIYSNAPDVIYLFTGRKTLMLPAIKFPDSKKDNPKFRQQIDRLKNDFQNGAGLVFLRSGLYRWYLPREIDFQNNWDIKPMLSDPSGTLYSLQFSANP